MRAKEALSLCNKKSVRDCRVAEIRQSLLNSQRLQEDYFVTHENDLLALRHDAKLKAAVWQLFKNVKIREKNLKTFFETAITENTWPKFFNTTGLSGTETSAKSRHAE